MKNILPFLIVFLLTASLFPAYRPILRATIYSWTTFHGDNSRAGYSDSSAPSTNDVKWSYTTGNMIFSSPAVAYDKIFIGSYDGKMYALDQTTGSYVWSFNAGEAIVSSPAVADNKVFFCTIGTTSVPSRKVYCLSQSSGSQVWMRTIGQGGLVENFGSPGVDAGKVILYGGDGLLYCLDESDGHTVWTAGVGNVAGAPAIVGGYVYVAADNWLLKALNENTGVQVWSYYEGKPMHGNTVYGSRVFTSTNEAVLAIFTSSGSFSWRRALGGGFIPCSSPSAAYSQVFVLALDGTRDRVYALSQTGSENWHRDLGTYGGSTPFFGHSSPAIADNKVFVGSWDHKVYALDADDGSILWSYSTGDFVVSSPAVSDGAVFIGSWDRKVYCFKSNPGAISGRVTDAVSGSGIYNALVSASGPSSGSAYSDSNGYYTISGLTPGSYQVTASKSGYASQTKPATVSSGSTTTVDFQLQPNPGKIGGRVTDASTGNGIAGATVSYSGPNSGSVNTDSNGDYLTPDLQPGGYSVTASKSGYVPETKSTTVNSGQTSTVNFQLQPESSNPSDEYIWSMELTAFDNSGDGYNDAAFVRLDVDTTDGTLSVTAYGYLYNPADTQVDSESSTWTITGTAYDYGELRLHVPSGGSVGQYRIYVEVYDNLGNFEDSREGWLDPLYPPDYSGSIYVTVTNLDDDIHSVQIYINGVEWGWLNNIPHFATFSTSDIQVRGNEDHKVEIFWSEPDEEDIPIWHSKSLILYVESGERVGFAFDLSPIFKVIQGLNNPDFPLPDLWESLGFTTKIVYADFYKVTSDGHFEIYYDPSSPYISQSYLDYVDQAAIRSWARLVPFLGSPYDLDGDGRIEILITNLNVFPEGSYRGGMGYCVTPPKDPNGLGLIYVDDNMHMWLGNWQWINTTVSHEFTHMIEYNYHPLEDDWIMEGVAQFGSDYVWDISGQLQHYVTVFADNPDVQLDYPWSLLMDKNQARASWYCASFVFFEFLAEKFGQPMVRTVLEKTVDYDGRVAVEQATGQSFWQLFDEFAIWNYVNEYSGTSDGGNTFEGTDIYAEPFETNHLPTPPAYLHGSGSFDAKAYTTDYIKFVDIHDPLVEIKFYGDLGRAFEVRIILIAGEFSSYEVRYMPLGNNEGSLLIQDATRYSQLVLMIVRLDDGCSDATYQWDAIPRATPSLTVKAHSPVNLMITAPDGLRVGYDPATGSVVNEIAGATYSGPGTEPQEIFIPNAIFGTYQVSTFGTATGSYTITVESIANGLTTDIETWQGFATSGQQETQTVDVDAHGQLTMIYGPWVSNIAVDYPVVDSAIYNSNLYIASKDYLYVYDGSNWAEIQAPAYITSLMYYNGKLYLGTDNGVYSYNMSAFVKVLNTSGYIKVLGIYKQYPRERYGKLYAGTFLANPPKLYYMASDGIWHEDTTFSTILNFSGPFGSIDSLATYNYTLYIASGGTIYRFNGTDWSIANTYNDVYAFLDAKIYNGKLYLATRDHGWRKPLYQGGTGFSGRIIEFDGENWTTVFDHDYWIFSLGTYDNALYAGTANRIYTYNGTEWNLSFSALEGAYYAISLITYNNEIYTGMGNGRVFADPTAEIVTVIQYPPGPTIPEFPPATLIPTLLFSCFLVIIFFRRRYRRMPTQFKRAFQD